MIAYKGYIAKIEIDFEDKLLHGRVQNTKDLIVFDGQTVEEVVGSFHNAVDFYLENCAENGEKPEKPD